MSWLLPWALGAAGAAALIAGLLHLLARDRPARWLLPTARFVTPGRARATRRARTPRDRALLALRVLALLLAGAAFAGPVLHPDGGSVVQVVVLDRTEPGSRAAALDAARARLRAGDRLVAADSVASVVGSGRERQVLDSLARADSSDAAEAAMGGGAVQHAAPVGPATMSAAIVAAVRAAATVAPSADSVALVIIAAAPRQDAALASIRALWPGRGDVVTIAVSDADSIPPGAMLVRGASSDAVVAGARVAGARPSAGTASGVETARGSALLVRGLPTAGDSAFAARGGMLLAWPLGAGGADTLRGVADTVGGFVVSDAAVIYRAVRTHAPPAGRPVARWIDGPPAVTEVPHGAGCIRTAAIDIPAAGDLTLRPAFQRALRLMLTPCGDARTAPAARDSIRMLLAGGGALASGAVMRARVSRSRATPWLLAAALALLLIEPVLRRPRRDDAVSP